MSVMDEKRGALTGAAISAATVAAAYALKHALEGRSDGPVSRSDSAAAGEAEDGGDEADQEDDSGTAASGPSPLLAALQEVVRRRLRSMFEDAVRSVGRWVGEKAPELECNPLVRLFLEAFGDAAAGRTSGGAAS
jgi:hypothetical protein